MRAITIVSTAFCLVAASTVAGAGGRSVANSPAREELNSGLVYGEGHAFWLTVPDGWVLDNTSGVEQGLHAVFYPTGSSWSDSPVVMYANTAPRDTVKAESLESFIAGDVDEARAKSPHVRAQRAPDLLTANGKHAAVRIFTGDKWGNSEEVAYIPEHQVFVLLTLTSKTPDAFARSTHAFESLVKSYEFFTEDVELPK